MSLITCGNIHEGHEWFGNDSLCLAVLLCEQFCRFAKGRAKLSIKSYVMRFFCLRVFSSSEKLGKITSIWSNCQL